jgi:hypothetical protein
VISVWRANAGTGTDNSIADSPLQLRAALQMTGAVSDRVVRRALRAFAIRCGCAHGKRRHLSG